jgi:ABC-type multidrug transport system fused ATPase/permease subunit
LIPIDIKKGTRAYNAVHSLGKSAPQDSESREAIESQEKDYSTISLPLIEFRNASFAYPTRRSRPVLRGLDLKVLLSLGVSWGIANLKIA